MFSCSQKPTDTSAQGWILVDSTKHFKISSKEEVTLLEVINPFVGSSLTEKYVFYPKGNEKVEVENATHYFETPLNRLAVSSTTHIGFIEELNELSKLVAVNNIDFIFSSSCKKLIEKGEVVEIGKQDVNTEALISQNTDVFLAYAIDIQSYKKVQKLRKMGQKVILISEYMEQEPLAKSKWLLAFATLFSGETKIAARVKYLKIEDRYKSVKQKANKSDFSPTVIIGYPWKGTWYMSGGNSFQSRYFRDANAQYIWRNDTTEGGLPLNIEEVISKGLNADFWINPGSKVSYDVMAKEDKRFTFFKAFKEKNIYSNYNRVNSLGGNDYWESGVVRPDLILSDLVNIFHFSKNDSNMYYYKSLDE